MGIMTMMIPMKPKTIVVISRTDNSSPARKYPKIIVTKTEDISKGVEMDRGSKLTLSIDVMNAPYPNAMRQMMYF